MSRNEGNSIRRTALAGLFALGLTTSAFAQSASPSTGLGQSWPNAADVSTNPNWHVYVFVLNGIEYVQVNDLNGTVHAAVGTAGGATIVLPIGVDAQNVTPAPASASTTSAATTVYSDSATTVTATPQSNGTTQFNVAPAAVAADCNTYNCGGGRGS
ncbi:MAG: hypothetical protein WA777_16025 [Rhodanobacter sp.]